MRGRLLPLVLVAAVVGVAGVAGCSRDPAPRASSSASRSPSAPPSLGGPATSAREVPTRPMDSVEKPVAAQLAGKVRREGLTLDYLDCPAWDGTVPARMTCSAYLDGVVARVHVHLRAAVEGRAVGFDADLADGVIATRRLEQTLRRQGASAADCGRTAAYPAKVGTEIVCAVTKQGQREYVVATVADRSGRVMIAGYRG